MEMVSVTPKASIDVSHIFLLPIIDLSALVTMVAEKGGE